MGPYLSIFSVVMNNISISRDFLCGFRKRKLERKKKAQEDLQRLLKEEKKRIKQEVSFCLPF